MHKLTTKLLHYLLITLLIIQNLIYPWISILPAPPPAYAQESPPLEASYSAQTPAPSPLDPLLDLEKLFSASLSAEIPIPEAIPEAIPETTNHPSINELRKHYRFDEQITFKLSEHIKKDSILLTDPTGYKQSLQPDGPTLTIDRPNGFRPGKYTLTLQLESGQIEEQSFSWGVLAINTNRSVYKPGQPVYLQMATLSDSGRTLCHAHLSLEIIDPKGTTSNPTIFNSDHCGINNVTDQPDYFAYYLPITLGTYQLKLTNLDNGYNLTDQFEVKEYVPFEVERLAATRINPFMSTYQMKIRLKANQDFAGTIKDSIPEEFELINSTASWQVNLRSGEEQTFTYTYQAPKISPELYFLGGLTIGDYQDHRRWQLASDADSSGDYRSSTSGSWATAGNWEKYNGSTWAVAGTAPATTDGVVTIRNTYTMTVAASVSSDQVIIQSGGQVTVSTGQTWTIANGTGTDLEIQSGGVVVLSSTTGALSISASANVDVYGTLTKANTSTTGSGGITITGTLNFKSGGTYEHNTDIGAIPLATWESGSTMKYIGNQATTTLPTNINQTYSNMTWAASASTSIKTFTSDTWTINSNFSMTGGSIIWRSGNSSSVTTTIGGNLSVSGGTFAILGSTGNANTDATFNVSGNLTYSGGTFNFCTTGNAGSIATINVTGDTSLSGAGTMSMSAAACLGVINASGNWSHTAATITESSTGNGTINFAKSGIQTYTSGGTVSNTINFTVNSGSTLQMAAESTVVSGGGTFTLSSGASLGITSANGITTVGTASGNIQTTTARTFNVGATYIYNRGGGTQNIGTGFPTNLTGTLKIDDSGSTVTLDNARTIASGGTLNLTNGTFAAGTNLTMASTSSITRSEGDMTGTPQGSGLYDVTYTGNSKSTGSELAGTGLRDVTVNATGGQTVTLDTTRSVNRDLYVSSGTFALSTSSLTIGATGTANSGNVKVTSGATISQSSSATTTILAASGSNCIGASGASCVGTPGTIGFYNLTIGNGSVTFTTAIGGTTPTVTVANTLTIKTNATFSVTGTLNVGGNWTTESSSTFTANSSTVNLNGAGGTTQTISGTNTFYTLSATGSSARTIKFPSSVTTTISNSLTLSGASGQLLTLDPSTPATTWTIDPPPSSISVSYTTVNYSTATECINATNSSGTFTSLWDFTGNNCTTPTATSFQRKTWYDGTRYWRSLHDGSNSRIIFEYSSDGTSWSENTSARISVNTNDFSLETDSTYAFIVYKNGYDISASAATSYPGISFGWGTPVTVYDGSSSTNTYSYPAISRDTNNIVWATSTHLSGTDYIIKAVSSTSANSIATWNTATSLDTSTNSNKYGTISKLSSGDMYAAWMDGTTLEGSEYGQGDSWYDANWSYRNQLTIDYTKVGSATQSDFAVLINTTDTTWKSTGNGGNVGQTDGGDFVFTSSNGTTKLNHEIEKYDATTGELIAWVKVPSLSHTTNTSLYIYYGNAGVANQWNASGTWSNTAGVWHLKESGNGTSGEYIDSTGVNNGTGGSSAYPTLTSSGKIDGAQDFDGTNDIITVNHDASLIPTNYLTLSAWVKLDTLGIEQTIIRKLCGTCTVGSDATYTIYITAANRVYFQIQDSGTSDVSYARTDDNGVSSTGVWYHIVGFWNATDGMKIYINNSDSTATVFDAPSGDLVSTTDTLRIGAAKSDAKFVDGIIDEVHISNTGYNANWVNAKYNNHNSPGTFYTKGTQESAGWGTSATIGTGTTGLTTTFTLSSDTSNYLHLSYINSSGHVVYRKYTTSWQTAVNLDTNSGNAYPTLSVNTSNNDVYVFWVRTDDIYYKKGVSPHASGDWDVSATAWKSTGTNTYSTSNYQGANKIFVLWYNGTTIEWDDLSISGGNTAPNNPTSLVQKTTGDVTLSTGAWHNSTSIKFSATASDTDNPDTLYLCVEIDQLGTSFSNTEDSCGSGVAYSGSGVSVVHTITVTDAQEYHWQARVKDTAGAYSSWVSYDVNAESARDVGVDTTAPTGGIVYDGTGVGVDSVYSDSSLSSLSANWATFNFNVAGISKYEYSIGTTIGGTDIKTWTDNSTTTSVTSTSLTLQSSTLYYVNVRATDAAGNVSSVVSSNGQLVSPSISFSISPATLTFTNLNPGNSFTNTQDTTLTTSTNAYNGYVIRAAVTDYLRSTDTITTIADFSGGTYASPATWVGSETGFGYTSSDTTIGGSNKFAGGTLYAPFSQSGPGDIVADHTSLVTGTPVSNESFTITYKVKLADTQAAKKYSTTVIYTATAQY